MKECPLSRRSKGIYKKVQIDGNVKKAVTCDILVYSGQLNLVDQRDVRLARRSPEKV